MKNVLLQSAALLSVISLLPAATNVSRRKAANKPGLKWKVRLLVKDKWKKFANNLEKVRELFFDLFANSFNKVFELILENEDWMR